MASFTLCFSTDEAAFHEQDGALIESEVALVVQNAVDAMKDGGLQVGEVHRLRDGNGNRVGYYVLQED